MKHSRTFKPKKKINYNRANLKRIRNFQNKHPTSITTKITPASLSLIPLRVPKFLNPIKIYRLPGDLILEDRISHNMNGELNGSMNDYGNFKKVISMNYDRNLGILSANLMNYANIFSSGELLIDRLRSLGLDPAKRFSDVVEHYMKAVNSKKTFVPMHREPINNSQYKLFIKNKQKIIQNLNTDKAYFLITDFNMNDEGVMQVFRFNFSKELLNVLFNSTTEAMYFIMKHGFPEYLSPKLDYYETFMTILNKIFFKSSTDTVYMDLILKNHEKVSSILDFIQEFYVEENYMEGFLIQIIKPLKLIQIEEICENGRYCPIYDNQNKYMLESECFFEQNYGIELNGIKEENNEMRCKYKEI